MQTGLQLSALALVFLGLTDITAQPYKQQHCSLRLENALEHLRRRSVQVKATRARSLPVQQTPYMLYQALYGQRSEPYDDFYYGGSGNGAESDYRGYYGKSIDQHKAQGRYEYSSAEGDDNFGRRQPHKLTVARVEVEDLRVKVPPSKATARWVEVDKCQFSSENSTLDTRLIFPDLSISGKVVLQPSGGRCHMILRLRHAGIEFHTIPIGFDLHDGAQSHRGVAGAASVRTDSHFAEPGFISVFAHGCQGPTGIRLRQNSKRRYSFGSQGPPPPDFELSEPQVVLGNAGSSTKRWSKYDHHQQPPPYYDIRSENYSMSKAGQHGGKPKAVHSLATDRRLDNADTFYDVRQSYRRYRRSVIEHIHSRQDQMHFSGDILNFADDELQDVIQPDARAFANIFSAGEIASNTEGGSLDRDVDDAFSSELERLFSMGVRSLLTTYMQRALQPAIKETLMENMGYTLSYG